MGFRSRSRTAINEGGLERPVRVHVITRVLAGGFDLNWLRGLRMNTFFLPGGLQRRLELVPRQADSSPVAKFLGGDSSRMTQ